LQNTQFPSMDQAFSGFISKSQIRKFNDRVMTSRYLDYKDDVPIEEINDYFVEAVKYFFNKIGDFYALSIVEKEIVFQTALKLNKREHAFSRYLQDNDSENVRSLPACSIWLCFHVVKYSEALSAIHVDLVLNLKEPGTNKYKPQESIPLVYRKFK
jgi:hypothetical protein